MCCGGVYGLVIGWLVGVWCFVGGLVCVLLVFGFVLGFVVLVLGLGFRFRFRVGFRV